ncbi:MAG: VWA domain-containing protein [Gammaproteobacteria bacterium]|nr:VWA domain-containing protein [Gammaproteobacteria bacterium]MCY4218667.1 VWA domain-containing protein [Gammaproteobacteria bacterium]
MTPNQIGSLLDTYLEPVLSTRRTSEQPTRGLLPLAHSDQVFCLEWTNIISKSNAEMAFQFVSKAPWAIRLMGTEGTRQWLLEAMDIYDREGLYPASSALGQIEEFAREYRLNHITVRLEEVKHVLEIYLRGLSGREMNIQPGPKIFTDTQTLYLPSKVNRFNEYQLNYAFYKSLTVHLWAQTWFGTFKRPNPNSPHLHELFAEFDDHGRALRLFNLLETYRLNACIERELPGLAREQYGLYPTAKIHDSTWKSMIHRLQQADSTVLDTLNVTSKLYLLQQPWPDPFPYQGEISLESAKDVIENRLENDQITLRKSLSNLIQSLLTQSQSDENLEGMDTQEMQTAMNESGTSELTIDGESISMPDDLEKLISSIYQDLDTIPQEWLDINSDDQQDDGSLSDGKTSDISLSLDQEHAFLYDEWDFRRQNYRKNWCVLTEHEVGAVYDDFVVTTMEKYHHLVNDIKRHFEALRGNKKCLKAQAYGDDIDLDAVITARSDMLTGVEMSDRLYSLTRKQERDLAVVFMVDLSGSTKGWINDAERESLLLLCQALEILGDQYGIFGFSGMTRNRCEVYKIKTFDEPYNSIIEARISGLRPQDYTRMGVVIRHLGNILNSVEARTRVLITLTDGKPDDYDGYRGEYGIEDTRQALFEVRDTGIHPFCITIDQNAGEYLPHLYGPASFVVVDEVRKLPLKVAEIYRKLTT